MRRFFAVLTVAVALVIGATARAAVSPRSTRTMDGSGNNVENPDWGKANTPYRRIAPTHYADGIAKPVGGPPARYVSNRIFNDTAQNIFSENGVSQWGFAWGQFIDHTIGLRQDSPDESAPIPFDVNDPLEAFHNDFGSIGFTRTPPAPGTGATSPRQQINTVSSFIDGSNIYSDDASRLEWLRVGSVDGNVEDNGAKLLLPDGLLPRSSARGAVPAPAMAFSGRLLGSPSDAMIAGDVRADENIALTATQTLFAREHNRIVDALPASLPEEEKFQIARRVVGAEQQYITYHEFLPALGVTLSPYRGYDPHVDASLSNEFATVGYRAHSMVHGELEPTAPAGTYSAQQLAGFTRQGLEVEQDGDAVKLVTPLNLTFENPNLLASVGVGPVLRGLGGEREYRNDEQIDNQMRSVLFQTPKPGAPNPSACLDGPTLPDCFTGVVDLGAIDVERGRDHGIPSYNALRRAYGLAPERSFTAITGDSTDRFPTNDPTIDRHDPIDDPNILDVLKLTDANGNDIALGSEDAENEAIRAVRRTTVAARLKAIYGDVDRIDAFVGMVAEKHVAGTEFGELQRAIWKREFESLRDGDRFFYGNDRALTDIRRRYGVTYRRTLADVIRGDTGADVQADVFHAGG
jgi:hypothetical protein